MHETTAIMQNSHGASGQKPQIYSHNNSFQKTKIKMTLATATTRRRSNRPFGNARFKCEADDST